MEFIKLIKSVLTVESPLFQRVKCIFGGKTQTLIMLGIYGISYNPPKGSFGLSFHPNGYEGTGFAILDSPDKRFKNLKEGELCVGNYETGKYVLFKEDGTIEIEGDVTVNGTVTATDFVTSVAAYNTHVHSDPQGGVVGVPE